jgi:DNA-binding CsgD family transcriptional regulator
MPKANGGLPTALSPRERAALRGAEQGLTTTQIAQRIGIPGQSVRNLLSVARRVASTERLPNRLTPGELAALRWAAQGLTNAEIAHRMGMKEQSIKNLLSTAYRVLGARDRTGALELLGTEWPDWRS